ncbi:MAG: hypothetical protein WA705_01270 [Candidatus Ozemobacteraceae bacterium]
MVIALVSFVFMTGCGTNEPESASSPTGTLSAAIVPVRTMQDGAVDLDALYISATGGGFAGGWVTDTTGAKVENSELGFSSTKKIYERLITRARSGFPSGIYRLNYTLGTETLQVASANLNWTSIPAFPTPPKVTWDPNSRYLTVTSATLAGTVRYQLEVWNVGNNFLAFTENETASVEVLAYISVPGTYEIHLWANVYEAGALVSRALYISPIRTL